MSLSRRLYGILHLHDVADPVARLWDRIVLAAVLLGSLAAWFDLGGALGEEGGRLIRAFDIVVTVILAVEYLLRLAAAWHHPLCAGQPAGILRYALSPLALIDLMAVLPAVLSLFFPIDLALSRILRLMRLMAVIHVFRPQWDTFLAVTRGFGLRMKVHALLFMPDAAGPLHDLVERVLMGAIAVSVVALALETVPEFHDQFRPQFQSLELLIGMIFLVEYVSRLFSVTCEARYAQAVRGRLRYALTCGALIDLIALLPLLFYFAGWELGLLPALRLLRLFKLTRYSSALSLIVEVVRDEKATLQSAVFILMVLTTLAATGVYFAEHSVQPDKFSSVPTAMYWAVVTLTSIGYGDVYPITPLGRALTMILAVASLGMMALPAGIIATAFSERLHRNTEAKGRQTTDPAERAMAIYRGLGADERRVLLTLMTADASGGAERAAALFPGKAGGDDLDQRMGHGDRDGDQQ